MPLFTRRQAFISAASAAAAFGAAGPVEVFAPRANAQSGGGPTPMNPKGLKFFKTKVGDVDITQVFDGAVERAFDPAFIKNASVDDTKASLKALGLPDVKIPNTYTVTVARIGGKQVMFDSGNGSSRGNPNVGLLAENMKAAGIAKIDTIVLTHFHPDHIFGLMTKENAQVYGDIEIIAPETEFKFWTDPATIAKLNEARQPLAKRIQATMPAWKNIRTFAGDIDVMPGIRAVASNGHTPGHTSYLISSGSAQFMVLGDVTNIPALNLRNPGWHIAFDQDAQMAEAARRRMLDRVIADRIVCAGYHWGMPGCGTLQKDGNGYALVAAS
ncbi:MAG: MBL fold metallo-hydrolase [Hyphomicrobiaceae bacterium]|nr:MAG: MBL fold metallo-hydrolase [Hyphomicrobiaceae bacterium]